MGHGKYSCGGDAAVCLAKGTRACLCPERRWGGGPDAQHSIPPHLLPPLSPVSPVVSMHASTSRLLSSLVSEENKSEYSHRELGGEKVIIIIKRHKKKKQIQFKVSLFFYQSVRQINAHLNYRAWLIGNHIGAGGLLQEVRPVNRATCI